MATARNGNAPLRLTGAAGWRARWSWALFDWAQQPYFTLVGSFVFRPYYVAAVAATPERGQVEIGLVGALAGLAVALLGPIVGIAIDRRSPKAWLATTSIPFILSCIGLWWVAPGYPMAVAIALTLLVVSSVTAEITTTVNNAMLPAVALPGGLGRLSGDAVALGFLAGIVSMVIMVAAFLLAPEPLFGLDKATHEPERFVGPFSALWYVLFLIPLFLFYPSGTAATGETSRPFAELKQLLRSLPGHKSLAPFLAGRMLVGDALGAVSVFGSIVATTSFGWGAGELGFFGLLLLVFAGVGSALGGRLDDRIGARRSVMLSCGILAIGLIGVGSATADHIFFVVPTAPPTPDDGLMAAAGEQVFLVFAALVGLAQGPLTSSMRTWFVEIAPCGEEGRWFGLYAFAGRATAFLAPLMISVATALTGELRASIPVVLSFLFVGWVAFWIVPLSPRRASA